ncbi:MAG: cysteine desulfurase [Acidobacteria bacterium]|jgi:cysteine desulfurase/selenocysteine lyase|nr:cysteine desulfurase [Acidobacteriota bacterium]|tara:strand:- start:958 stop:2223 length:1266 start_codon:yes stop_codon:yes gene_type:complete
MAIGPVDTQTETAPLDVGQIQQDFPILQRKVHGKRLIYLDNAATSQKPQSVIDAISYYYSHTNANVHRGVHCLAEEATEAYETARHKVCQFINGDDPNSIVFTRNTTESVNLVAHAWGRKFLGKGDEVVLTVAEHHSNLVPWQLLAGDTGCKLRFIDIDDEGHLRIDRLDEYITEKTKLVCMGHVSNALGTIHSVRTIACAARAVGALVLVDGAQGAPHGPVNVEALDCDFYAYSPHKALGPLGIGVLWARRDLLEEMNPFLGGGEMIRNVSLERSTWAGVPYKFEAGTPSVADAVGLGAATDYLMKLGMENVRTHEKQIVSYAMERLTELPFIRLFGPRDPADRCGLVSFIDTDIHPHDLGTVVDQHGVAIRAGHHCAKPLMHRLGVVATARASFYIYNEREDVDRLVDSLLEARKVFGL